MLENIVSNPPFNKRKVCNRRQTHWKTSNKNVYERRGKKEIKATFLKQKFEFKGTWSLENFLFSMSLGDKEIEVFLYFGVNNV